MGVPLEPGGGPVTECPPHYKVPGCAQTPRSLPSPNVSLERNVSSWGTQGSDPMASADVLTFPQELLHDLPTGDSEGQLSKGQRLWEVGQPCPPGMVSSSILPVILTQNNFLPTLGASAWGKGSAKPSETRRQRSTQACAWL